MSMCPCCGERVRFGRRGAAAALRVMTRLADDLDRLGEDLATPEAVKAQVELAEASGDAKLFVQHALVMLDVQAEARAAVEQLQAHVHGTARAGHGPSLAQLHAVITDIAVWRDHLEHLAAQVDAMSVPSAATAGAGHH